MGPDRSTCGSIRSVVHMAVRCVFRCGTSHGSNGLRCAQALPSTQILGANAGQVIGDPARAPAVVVFDGGLVDADGATGEVEVPWPQGEAGAGWCRSL
jgi:hypothetical protein